MQQRAFEPIYPNPYIAGNPIRTREMFFGRVDEFHFIARALEDGHKAALIILFGERRSGKSSILYQILNGRLGEAFLPIFVDMQIMAGISSDAEFFGRIIADSCQQLARHGLAAERFLPKLEETTAANVFRQFLQELKSHFPERALLLLIDEYEILEAKINESSLSRHILTFFAGLLETDLVSFVFTGSKSLEAHDKKIWGEELFRKATSRKISFLTKDDTERLITQPLQNQVDFAKVAVAQIYTLTAGQPFYTQMICQNLVYHLNEVQKRLVTLADVEAVVDGVLENPPPQLTFNWSEHSSERKLALSLLAEFSEAPQTFLSASDLCREIRRKKLALDLDANFFHTEFSGLFQDEYVLQKDHRKYAFRLDLYRRWVRHDHDIWQVKKEVGAKEIARLTHQIYIKEEKRRQIFRRLEHAIAIGLAVAVMYVLWKLLFPPKHVIVQANGGPFLVLLNDDTVGTSKGQKDSTRFEMPEALTKGIPYKFKVILAATGESWDTTATIEKDDQEVKPHFSLHPLQVITDAASVEMRLGGLPAVKTEEDQPAAWQQRFEVCAGKYVLWAKDRRNGEEWQNTIAVPGVSDTVCVDFPSLVVLTLRANLYPFEYAYQWPHSNRQEKGRADSACIVLRGQPKGVYNFAFINLETKQPISIKSPVKTDTIITIAFDPKWRPSVPASPGKKEKTLAPTKYTMRIKSDPSEASVSLNGMPWRNTPCDTNLVVGEYPIAIRKNGYDPIIETINLVGNVDRVFKLTPQYGCLKLVVQDELGRSLPDVKVFVDGDYKGETPIKEIKLLAIEHALRLDRSGARKDTSFVIVKADTLKLTLKMMKRL